MTNEDKILAMLETLTTDVSQLTTDVSNLTTEMNERFDAANERFDSIEFSLNEAFKDIGIVETRVKQHEKEFHNVS